MRNEIVELLAEFDRARAEAERQFESQEHARIRSALELAKSEGRNARTVVEAARIIRDLLNIFPDGHSDTTPAQVAAAKEAALGWLKDRERILHLENKMREEGGIRYVKHTRGEDAHSTSECEERGCK